MNERSHTSNHFRPSPWLGPLSRAPASLAATLRTSPSLQHLLSRGWSAEQTLLYVPRTREGYDLNVVVVGRTVNVGDERPVLWVFSTIGLSAVEQRARPSAHAFRRVELVLALNNSGRDDPFSDADWRRARARAERTARLGLVASARPPTHGLAHHRR